MSRASQLNDRRYKLGLWGDYKFRCFISYAHADTVWTDRVEQLLKSFVLPRELTDVWTPFGPPPKRITPFFRDRGTQGAHHSLDDALKEALDNSAALVVICSPNAARSEHVANEIKHFVMSGRRDRIFSIIVDGEPNDPDRQCFPDPLCYLLDDAGEVDPERRLDPVAADARHVGDDWPEAGYKLIAGLLGVDANLISKRERDRERWERTRRRGLVGLLGLGALAAGLAGFSYTQLQQSRQVQNELIAAGAEQALIAAETDKALLIALEGTNASRAMFFARPKSDAVESILHQTLSAQAKTSIFTRSILIENAVAASGTGEVLALLKNNVIVRFDLFGNELIRFQVDGDGSVKREGTAENPARITGIAISPDGKRIGAGTENGHVVILNAIPDNTSPADRTTGDREAYYLEIRKADLNSGILGYDLQAYSVSKENSAISTLTLGNSLTAVATNEGLLKITDSSGSSSPLRLIRLNGIVETIALDPSETLGAILTRSSSVESNGNNCRDGARDCTSISSDTVIQSVFRIRSSVPLLGDIVDASNIYFGPHGQYFYTLFDDDYLYGFEVGVEAQDGTPSLRPVFNFSEPVLHAAFSYTDNRLLTIGRDYSVRIWEHEPTGDENWPEWQNKRLLPGQLADQTGTPVLAAWLTQDRNTLTYLWPDTIDIQYSPEPDTSLATADLLEQACGYAQGRKVSDAVRTEFGLIPTQKGPCDRSKLLGLELGLSGELRRDSEMNTIDGTTLELQQLATLLPEKSPAAIVSMPTTSEPELTPTGPPLRPKMRAGARGLYVIKTFEGLQLESFQDISGIWTIGYGYSGPAVGPGQVITEQEAENLLLSDLERFEQGINALVKVDLNQNQFDALVSFTYNIGLNAFKASTVLRKLNKGDYVGAAEAMTSWNKATVGGFRKELTALTRRRTAEVDLFLYEDDPVGTFSGIRGDNILVSDAFSNETRVAVMGEPVFQLETITTPPDTSAQIRFEDGSVFTIGPDSEVRLDDTVLLTTRGKFRFLNGGDTRYQTETPTATIGIRG